MLIEKFSIGMGDRFAKEGCAQLSAIQEINKHGIPVVPVWNKSNREHTLVKTTQASVLKEAKDAVAAMEWFGSYYVDADHINLKNVDGFLEFSNFFTIDVADFIGQAADAQSKADFMNRNRKYLGKLVIPNIDEVFDVTEQFLETIANKYLLATQEVAKIYNYIVSKKGADNFIPEVSMDETKDPQTPIEMFFILSELKFQGVMVQTIAPKFTGLFAKGVDYIGDLPQFEKEFEQDVAVIQYAIKTLGLPSSLKLSVHSGSDKFSLYKVIKKSLKKFNAGLHLKTAGTTWLEEIIGLAKAGGEGLAIAKKIYASSMERYDEVTAPYATVLHLDKSKLPSVAEVNSWNSEKFANSLIHNQSCKDYDPNFRQLIHVGFRVAAELGDEYMNALDKYRDVIAENVKYNLLERHLKNLFF